MFGRSRFNFLIALVFLFLTASFLSFRQVSTVRQWAHSQWRVFSPDGSVPMGAESEQSYIGALVAVARENSDVEWMETALEYGWIPQIYDVDAEYEGERTLTVPQNKGHEAMVYLTYIVDNYDALPPYAIFIHGHLKSWHQEADIISIIENMQFPAIERRGYVSLRCDWYPSCPGELRLVQHDAHVWGPGVHRQDAEDVISGEAWDVFFPNATMPETLASQCCAQFVATRDAIRRNKREDYIRMRQWLLDTDLHDDISGRVLEKLWAFIMTGNAVNCPSPYTCACEFFGKCEPQIWPTPPQELGPLPDDSLPPEEEEDEE